MAPEGGVAATDNDKLPVRALARLDQVASYVLVQSPRCRERQASRVGENIKDGKMSIEFRLQRFNRPLGEHRRVVNGLGACGVIIEDNNFALACENLFADGQEHLLGPFRREVTK